MKIWSCTACLIAFLLINFPVQAQIEEPVRVLVLHGGWDEGIWDGGFDNHLVNALQARLTVPHQISFQRLGVGSLTDEATVEFYKNFVVSIVASMGVDIIVSVLPAAAEFVKQLQVYNTLPLVMVLPGAAANDAELTSDRVKTVLARSDLSIVNTLSVASQLQPGASTIEVFVGSERDELQFGAAARRIINESFSEYAAKFHYNMSVPDTEEYLSLLSDESIVLTLPYMAGDRSSNFDSLKLFQRLSSASAVPLFGIADPFLGYGLTGGYFHTAEAYATAASEAVFALVEDTNVESPQVGDEFGSIIFDYNQVQRFSLPVNSLEQPFTVLNQPSSLLAEYRNTVYVTVLMFFALAIITYQLFRALKKSEAAKLQLQVSERRAKESQLRYEVLARSTLDVIWTWDQTKRQTTYCSPSIMQLAGYTPEEFLNLSMRDIMTEESAEKALQLVFSTALGSTVFEVDLIHKDGSKVPCEIAAQPIVEGGKSVDQWVGVTRDISKRKQQESNRLILEGQLRQAQKFESLGTLAGGIAHDFNNMLGVMIGLNELLKLKLADNAAATAIVDKLMETADRAKALVSQILAFSRQGNLNKTELDLGELAADALQLVQAGLPKSVKLEKVLSENPIQIIADPNQVSQVLIVILTNAFEALEQEHGEIHFELNELEIGRRTECLHGHLLPGKYAKITVSDNGLGVSSDRIDKIFDPFYTSKDLGSGMGLSIARGLVLAHKGGIDFRSVPFKGSSISVYFPVSSSSNDKAKDGSLLGKASRSTILLIDDQIDLLETVGMMLDALGHDCIQCADPKQALELIASDGDQFDIVITDYSMPEVTGIDIANFCATKRPTVPVILATGYSDSAHFVNSGEETRHHILSKPFGLDELKAVLNTVSTSSA